MDNSDPPAHTTMQENSTPTTNKMNSPHASPLLGPEDATPPPPFGSLYATASGFGAALLAAGGSLPQRSLGELYPELFAGGGGTPPPAGAPVILPELFGGGEGTPPPSPGAPPRPSVPMPRTDYHIDSMTGLPLYPFPGPLIRQTACGSAASPPLSPLPVLRSASDELPSLPSLPPPPVQRTMTVTWDPPPAVQRSAMSVIWMPDQPLSPVLEGEIGAAMPPWPLPPVDPHMQRYRAAAHGAAKDAVIEETYRVDPTNPLCCPLHRGGYANELGYSRNASGYYSMYSPPCSGCRTGQAERDE
jgi:hypothetical protein